MGLLGHFHRQTKARDLCPNSGHKFMLLPSAGWIPPELFLDFGINGHDLVSESGVSSLIFADAVFLFKTIGVKQLG